MTSGRRSVGLGEPGRRIGAAWAFALRAVRVSGRPAGGKPSGGVCATEERGRTVPPGVIETKEFTPYRAWSAAPDDSGGFWDKGRKARLRDTAAPAKLFAF